MKNLLRTSLLAALAPLAWAAPNPLRVLPESDILVVLDRTDTLAAAIDVWRDAYAQSGLGTDTQDTLFGGDVNEAMRLVLGISEDGKTMSAKSAVCALTLPEGSLANLGDADAKCPEGFGWYAAVENPKVNLAALDALTKKKLDKDTETFALDGAWRTLKAKDAAAADAAFIGWRPIDEGLAFAVCADRAAADAAFANAAAPTGRLADALKAPNVQGPWARLVVADVQAILEGLCDTPEARQRLALQAPGLDKLRAATLTASCTPDGTFRFGVVLEAADAEAAQLLRDQLIALKTLYGQMMLPMLTGLPDSKAADLVRRVAVGTAGASATLNFTLTPAEAIAAAKELQAARQKAKPALSGTSGDPFEDDTLHFGDKP